jgi:hypothetical protein
MLEVKADNNKNWDISPRPLGPRFLDIAIIVMVERAMVGSWKIILKKNEIVVPGSRNSIL